MTTIWSVLWYYKAINCLSNQISLTKGKIRIWVIRIIPEKWLKPFGVSIQQVSSNYRSSHHRSSIKNKAFLESSQNSHENTCARVSFLIKLAGCARASFLIKLQALGDSGASIIMLLWVHSRDNQSL